MSAKTLWTYFKTVVLFLIGFLFITRNIWEVLELILFVEGRVSNILLQESVFGNTRFEPLLTFKSVNTFRCSLLKFLISREKELMRKNP